MPIFETAVKMNIAASLTAAAVLTVKYVLERLGLPRRVLFLLWLVIAFRLMCPTVPQSQLSVMNLFTRETAVEQLDKTDKIAAEQSAAADSDKTSAPPDAISVIWLCGTAVMLAYGAVSYARLKRRLRFAVRNEGNVYFADNIPTAFVLGVLRPKIYIPSGTERPEYIIAHERTHIRRLDHISKLLAYALLSFNWFNPVNWLLFRLFSDDIELACDECVTSRLNAAGRREYMTALLDAAAGKNGNIPYHVCFSENITKKRIKAMLRIKKSSAPIITAAVLCCLASGAAFGTSAVTAEQVPIPHIAEPTEAPKPTDARASQPTAEPKSDDIPPETESVGDNQKPEDKSAETPAVPYNEPDNAGISAETENGAEVDEETVSVMRMPGKIINTPIPATQKTLPIAEDNSDSKNNDDSFNSHASVVSDTTSLNGLRQNVSVSSGDERTVTNETDNNADIAVNSTDAEDTDKLTFDENWNPVLPEGWLTEEEMQDKFGYIVVHFGQSEITADHSTDEEKAAIRESYDKVADRVGSEEALERFEQALGKEYMEELISR